MKFSPSDAARCHVRNLRLLSAAIIIWKHEQRVEWLEKNLALVGKRLGVIAEPRALVDFIATGGWVPMAFAQGGRPGRFVHVSDLLAKMGI